MIVTLVFSASVFEVLQHSQDLFSKTNYSRPTPRRSTERWWEAAFPPWNLRRAMINILSIIAVRLCSATECLRLSRLQRHAFNSSEQSIDLPAFSIISWHLHSTKRRVNKHHSQFRNPLRTSNFHRFLFWPLRLRCFILNEVKQKRTMNDNTKNKSRNGPGTFLNEVEKNSWL